MLRKERAGCWGYGGKGRHRRGEQDEEQHGVGVEKETQDSKGWEDGTGVTSCSPEDRDVM